MYGGLLHVRGEMLSQESMEASSAQNAVASATSKSLTKSTSNGFSGEASYRPLHSARTMSSCNPSGCITSTHLS